MDELIIEIDGVAYSGWEEVTFFRSIAALCGNFSIQFSDKTDGKDFRFAVQKKCLVKLGSNLVLTGFVDSVKPSIQGDSHTVVIDGRDITCDLVDCSVVGDKNGKPHTGSLYKVKLEDIAKDLVKLYGLRVVVKGSTGDKFPRFAIQKGESVFEAIDRAAKLRGKILITDEKGSLVITESGSDEAGVTLKYGANIKSANGSYDSSNRFSLYRVETQSSNSGEAVGDLWKKSTDISGSYTDKGIRFRPFVMTADAEADRASCKKRATMEALQRAAFSESFEVVVAGWRKLNGALWKINELVFLDVPPLYIKDKFLVHEVELRKSSSEGTTTRLGLIRKDAFGVSRALEARAVKPSKGTKVGWP